MRISDWSSDVCSSDLKTRPDPALTPLHCTDVILKALITMIRDNSVVRETVNDGSYIYTPPLAEAENEVAERLAALAARRLDISQERIDEVVAALSAPDDHQMNDQQKAALQQTGKATMTEGDMQT